MMRVLHVHSGNIFGGIETMMLTMARYQHVCPPLEFAFGLCFDGRLRADLTALDAPVYDLGAVRLRDPLSVRRARRKLGELLRTKKFDVVLTHSSWTQAAFGQGLRAAGVPLVFYVHNPLDGRHWLERLARRTPPDLILCNSKYTANSVSAMYPDIDSEIVYCLVSAPQSDLRNARARIRRDLNTSEDTTVIIQVGRMERWKGHASHLKALAQLNEMANWVCWIVGGAQRTSEHKYVDELKSLVQQTGIADRVQFLGQRDNVNDLLAAADIFCQPNAEGEPFGISFIEALYAGLPVVTTDIGAAREIVDDSCGVRVAEGNIELLTQALRELIADPSYRLELGNRGPCRARRLCDPATQLNKFHECIRLVSPREQAIA